MAISLGVYPIFIPIFWASAERNLLQNLLTQPGHLHPKNLLHLEWGFLGQQKQLIMIPIWLLFIVVNRYKHLVITIWLVVWNMTGLFSMSYMGCHPFHWRTPSFFKLVKSPTTSHGDSPCSRKAEPDKAMFFSGEVAAEEEETIDT